MCKVILSGNMVLLVLAAVVTMCCPGVLSSSTNQRNESKVLGEHDECTEVRRFYHKKGFNMSAPHVAIGGKELQICRNEYTCCTTEMEQEFLKQSVADFEQTLSEEITAVRTVFDKKFDVFNDFFNELIDNAKDSLDVLFERTYGDFYTDRSDIFMQLFDDLQVFYQTSTVDANVIFETFFTRMLQKVFELLNQRYVFDDAYIACIGREKGYFKSFDDLPEKLTTQISRALVSARTFVRGVEVGKQLVQKFTKFHPPADCGSSLTRMTHCGRCRGDTLIRPCPDVCVRAVGNCLADYRHLNEVWNDYVDEMLLMLDSLNGPFNIESVLEPFDVTISEAVMMLQEKKKDIRMAIFSRCGEPPRNTSFNPAAGDLDGVGSELLPGLAGSDYPAGPLPYPGNFRQSPTYTDVYEYVEESDKETDESDGGRVRRSTNNADAGDEDDEEEDQTKERGKKRGRGKKPRGRKRGKKRGGKAQHKTKPRKRRGRRLSSLGRRNIQRMSKNHRGGSRRLYQGPIFNPDKQSGNDAGHQQRGNSPTAAGTNLMTLIADMRLTVEGVRNYWIKLPLMICSEAGGAAESDRCWNGETAAAATGVDAAVDATAQGVRPVSKEQLDGMLDMVRGLRTEFQGGSHQLQAPEDSEDAAGSQEESSGSGDDDDEDDSSKKATDDKSKTVAPSAAAPSDDVKTKPLSPPDVEPSDKDGDKQPDDADLKTLLATKTDDDKESRSCTDCDSGSRQLRTGVATLLLLLVTSVCSVHVMA